MLIFLLSLINTDIYAEYSFELYLYLDALSWSLHINVAVMYALLIVHMLVLINLKQFEKFWAIIDKNLFRT
ncbi:MAG: hypothetical protein ACJAWW_001177 [Sulfurimonas sp.]|jgi:hypothetical protein